MNDEIGYIFDNRHFRDLVLTVRNINNLVASKEKREILAVRHELFLNLFNPDYFKIVTVEEVKLKFKRIIIYIVKDTRTNRGFGFFVEDEEVKYIHLKDYKVTDPHAKGKDWICKNPVEAIEKTGQFLEKNWRDKK